jgi:hypothetical protein
MIKYKLSVNISLFSNSMTIPPLSDKVLHILVKYLVQCNILSGGCHVPQSKTNRASLISFPPSTMLEDRSTCYPIELLDSICPTVPCRRWILQQFYTQWNLVHAWLDPAVRYRWVVVSQPEGIIVKAAQIERLFYRHDLKKKIQTAHPKP